MQISTIGHELRQINHIGMGQVGLQAWRRQTKWFKLLFRWFLFHHDHFVPQEIWKYARNQRAHGHIIIDNS